MQPPCCYSGSQVYCPNVSCEQTQLSLRSLIQRSMFVLCILSQIKHAIAQNHQQESKSCHLWAYKGPVIKTLLYSTTSGQKNPQGTFKL